MKSTSALAAALLLAGLAACSGHELVQGRSWLGPEATPRGEEYTPQFAARRGVSGWVVLQCTSTADFRASGCAPVGEQPQGFGLADAALKVTANVNTRHTDTVGDVPPRAGELVMLPVLFCQPHDPSRCAAMHQDVMVFRASAHAALELARKHRCEEALAAAATIAQPILTRSVAALCKESAAKG